MQWYLEPTSTPWRGECVNNISEHIAHTEKMWNLLTVFWLFVWLYHLWQCQSGAQPPHRHDCCSGFRWGELWHGQSQVQIKTTEALSSFYSLASWTGRTSSCTYCQSSSFKMQQTNLSNSNFFFKLFTESLHHFPSFPSKPQLFGWPLWLELQRHKLWHGKCALKSVFTHGNKV